MSIEKTTSNRPKRGKSKWKMLITLAVIIFVAIQFIRPGIPNPPVVADLQAPDSVRAILRNACYDCHSNETKLAWFDQPAPAYWLVARDVEEGRKVLNFSTIGELPKDAQTGKLFESLNQAQFGVMPLKQYTWLHHGARVSAEQIATLRNYLQTLTPHLRPDTAKMAAAQRQWEGWIAMAGARMDTLGAEKEGNSAGAVPPAPNGLQYISGYRNWQALTATDRFDNGTMRVIYGNEIAVRAMRAGQTHPWPDGTEFAKVAWEQLIDPAGFVRTGVFRQVELMVKDRAKYGATGGWGWGRWKGLPLKPYGSNANFTTECMNCHRPMEANDLVFTIPLADTVRFFIDDTIGEKLPMRGKVIASFIDKVKGEQTILYGNDIAARSARAGRTEYPAGAVLTVITWAQQDDIHWYGAKMPGRLRVAGQVRFVKMPDGSVFPELGTMETESSIKREVMDTTAAGRAAISRLVLAFGNFPAAVIP